MLSTRIYHITHSKDYGICSLYFWGCNLDCRMCLLKKEAYDCHLPENRLRIYDSDYASPKPSRFLNFAKLTELLSSLEIKSTFLMGAEPLQDPSLPHVLVYLKFRQSRITLLTNGLKFPPVRRLDEIIFSIKAVSPDLHRDYTGRDNAAILKNFRILARTESVKLYAETVFIPDYVDEAEIIRIAEFIASVNSNIPFRIDAYLPVPGLSWRPPAAAEIESLAGEVKKILPLTTCFFGDRGNTPLAYEIERVY
ncbi:MAG: radical SAM protein [Syntrophaceae bacterium]